MRSRPQMRRTSKRTHSNTTELWENCGLGVHAIREANAWERWLQSLRGGRGTQRTSNTSVAPGGMRPRPAPRAPYPSSGGMTSVRFPPSCTDGHRSESQARPSPLMARRRCLTQTDCKAQRHGKRAWNACMVMCRSQAGINNDAAPSGQALDAPS